MLAPPGLAEDRLSDRCGAVESVLGLTITDIRVVQRALHSGSFDQTTRPRLAERPKGAQGASRAPPLG